MNVSGPHMVWALDRSRDRCQHSVQPGRAWNSGEVFQQPVKEIHYWHCYFHEVVIITKYKFSAILGAAISDVLPFSVISAPSMLPSS